MSSFTFCIRVIRVARPFNIIMVALATWVTSILSNGIQWLTVTKISSASAMGLAVLGASVYHYGAAHSMYARKDEQLAFKHPSSRYLLVVFGLASMIGSVYIVIKYLNAICQIIVALDALIIVIYAKFLSRHWVTKNVVIAFVCISPVLIGWFSGNHLYYGVPYAILITFFVYLAREIVKDVQDRKVNQGFRLTLPLTLGIASARKIAGLFVLISIVFFTVFGMTLRGCSWYIFIPYLCTTLSLLFVAYSLFSQTDGREQREAKQLMVASSWLILTFFLLAVENVAP